MPAFLSLPAGVVEGADGRPRCWWPGTDPLYLNYHDTEWGRPVSNDNRLFEKLCLEGFQSGLSWLTILRKRENFRVAFAAFDFEKVARFGRREIERCLGARLELRFLNSHEHVHMHPRLFREVECDAEEARMHGDVRCAMSHRQKARAARREIRRARVAAETRRLSRFLRVSWPVA